MNETFENDGDTIKIEGSVADEHIDSVDDAVSPNSLNLYSFQGARHPEYYEHIRLIAPTNEIKVWKNNEAKNAYCIQCNVKIRYRPGDPKQIKRHCIKYHSEDINKFLGKSGTRSSKKRKSGAAHSFPAQLGSMILNEGSESVRPHVLLGISGSVATLKVPEIVVLLRKFADVKVIATKNSECFFNRSGAYNVEVYEAMESLQPSVEILTDDTEWNAWNNIGDPVAHVQLREWANLYLIAPLSANSLGKFANGLCDNLLTCTFRAWDLSKPIIIAPAMNTHMWNHPITEVHLNTISNWGVLVVPPVEKKLACGDIGSGAMASVSDILISVKSALKLKIEETVQC